MINVSFNGATPGTTTEIMYLVFLTMFNDI